MINLNPRALDAPGDAALRGMFAARKQFFIDQLQWNLPTLDDRFEIDQFDTPDARYLILLDPDDLRHRASTRLLPTTAPHLLGDLYSHLCVGGAPTGNGVWEISRFCLDPAQTPAERRDARNQLVTALADYALHHGISEYVGVAEAGWYHTVSKFGWACRTLGPVHRDNTGRILALSIAIDEDTLAGLRRTGIYAPLALKFEEAGKAEL